MNGKSSALQLAQTPRGVPAREQACAQFKTTKMLRVLKLLTREKWDKERLHREARNQAYMFQHGSVRSLGQPNGRGTEYKWEIRVDPELVQALSNASRQFDEWENSLAETVWNGLTLRSPAEVAVAEALQRRGILFFANAKCRLRTRQGMTETWETDFLVFHRGAARILEVDGKSYHQDPTKDYKRDRMFDREGIKSSRFSAIECLENADEAVEEFLELFEPSRLTALPTVSQTATLVDTDDITF